MSQSDQEELDALDSEIDKLSTETDISSRRRYATAIYNKGVLLERISPHDSVAAYELLASMLPDLAIDIDVLEVLAMGAFNRARLLQGMGLGPASLDAYEKVIREFSPYPESRIKLQVVKAALNKATVLVDADQASEALRVIDSIAAEYSADASAEIRDLVVQALANKASIAFRGDDKSLATAALDELDSMISNTGRNQTIKVQAMLQRAAIAEERGDDRGALRILGRVLGSSRSAPQDHELNSLLADASMASATILQSKGDVRNAIAAYSDVIARVYPGCDTYLRSTGITAAFNRGTLLAKMGRIPDELSSYEEAVRLAQGEVSPAFAEPLSAALLNSAMALDDLGSFTKVIVTCEELVKGFQSYSQPSIVVRIARALFIKGTALLHLERYQEALETLDELTLKFGASDDQSVIEQVIRASANKAAAYLRLGRGKAAEECYDDVIARIGVTPTPELLAILPVVMFNKAQLLGERGEMAARSVVEAEVARRFGSVTLQQLRDQAAEASKHGGYLRET